ncbi:MAG: hypothetical protein QOG69_105 [Actinomycetota bacterium]|nr:hypothetical protein [Actinomycetota bacterium]
MDSVTRTQAERRPDLGGDYQPTLSTKSDRGIDVDSVPRGSVSATLSPVGKSVRGGLEPPQSLLLRRSNMVLAAKRRHARSC